MSGLPPLVGLIGKKRSGKDTFAGPLVAEFGFQRVAFADPLRDAALRLDPWVGPAPLPSWPTSEFHRLTEVIDELGWERAKDHVPGVRETLQRLGTDVVRELDPDLWVDEAMDKVRRLRRPVRELPLMAAEAWRAAGVTPPTPRDRLPVVITDVRFPNEADAIRGVGGTLVRIVRPGNVDPNEHATERALDDYPEDLLIHNDGTLEQLQDAARSTGLHNL